MTIILPIHLFISPQIVIFSISRKVRVLILPYVSESRFKGWIIEISIAVRLIHY